MEYYLSIKKRKALVNVRASLNLEIILYIKIHKSYYFTV